MRTLGIVVAALGLGMLAGAGGAQAQAGSDVVLVAGGTGGTGRHVVTQLLEQGRTVRVLSRSEASARSVFGDAVEVAVGDVREPESLAAAVEGVRYIISAIGSTGRIDPSNSPEAVDYRGMKNLVEAAVAAGGVEHFVLVSSMGITQPTHFLNRVSNNILLWKGLGENSLRFSGLSYTIVRPGGLRDEPGGQTDIRVGQGDTMEQGSIARADVARVCVAALGRADAFRKTLEVVAGAPGREVDWESFFAPLVADPQGGFGG